MKIEPHQVHFLSAFAWPGRRQLRFARKGCSVQVQETGLVVQGQLRKLFMPLFDLAFASVLSEYATVTIPYRRIRSLCWAKRVGSRFVVTVLVWLPVCFLLLLFALPHPGQGVLAPMELAYGASLLAFLALVLTLYFDCWLLVSRCQLLFEQADGRSVLLSFRIRSRKVCQAFLEKVEANRRLIQDVAAPPGRPLPRVPAGRAAPFFPFVILLLYTLGIALGSPGQAWLGEGFFRWGLRLLFDQAPVLLLAFLLWRWKESLRWITAALLAVHGLLAVFWPGLLPLANATVFPSLGPTRGSLRMFPDGLDLRPMSLFALVYFLALAVAMSVPRVRQKNKTLPERPIPSGPGSSR
jgi:hypothetical protein